MKRILITGANRGLGVELVRQYVAKGERVFAACRKPDEAHVLQSLASKHADHLTIIQMEVTDETSIAKSVQTIRAHTNALDLLINNAAILYSEADFHQVNPHDLRHMLEVNTVAPVIVTQQYYELVKAGNAPVILNVSSQAGSISRRSATRNGGYAASKAALNMLTRIMANSFRDDGVTVVTMHPGWVKTDMGGPDAIVEAEQSATGMINILDGLTLADTGRFLQWDGEELPW